MDEPDPARGLLLRVVEGLIHQYERRALDIADVRGLDDPLDHEAVENLLLVLQDLEMLASLRANLRPEA